MTPEQEAAIRARHERDAAEIPHFFEPPENLIEAHADRATLLAALDEMRAENERLRMQLAACGVIAMSNTRESAKKARAMRPEYWCASVGEVEAAVDREMAHRERERALREALELLVDHQNGCPLPSYEKEWTRAMQMARAALAATAGAEQEAGA